MFFYAHCSVLVLRSPDHVRSPDHPILVPLCRAASYSKIDAAMPAFNDSTRGECGIVTNSSARDKMSAGTPAPSLPTTSIAAPVKSAWCSGLPLCDEVA